ncbi:flippase [Chloroflexota bacterium]
MKMNTAHRIIKNTGSLLISEVIGSLLTFTATVYIARVLGPGDFGKISFAIAIIFYFTLIADPGLSILGTRQVARDKEKIKDYVGSTLTLRLCLATIGFVLLLLVALFINKPLEIKYIIILYGLGLIPIGLSFAWVFRGVEKMEYIGLGRILTGVIYIVLVLSFFKSSEQLLLVPCFWVGSNLLAAGLLISIFVRSFGKPRLRFNLASWRSLLKQALPMGFAVIMGYIMLSIDTVMLGFMKSNEEVGYYNAAYKIIIFLSMMSASYSETIYPLASSYYQVSLDSLKRLLQFSTKLMSTLALPLAVGGTILARPIMNLIFGAKYDNGIIALQILIWATAVAMVRLAYSRGLLSSDRERRFARVVTAGAIVNIILNLILIPPLGFIGAAIATVAAETVVFLGFYTEFRKVMEVPLARHLVKPLIASAIMSLFLYWGLDGLNLNVIALIFGGAFIYFVFLLAIKGLSKQEMRLIRSTVFANKKREIEHETDILARW